MKKWSEAYKRKYIAPEDLVETVRALKSQGKRIATLNGSFDLLHAGHLEIIYQTAQVADVSIVALNTDSSIQQYKSKDRPIIPLEYRLQMIAALEFVDYVTCFAETDPRELLRKIAPHVHVNGAEYGEDCLEASVVKEGGGHIHIVSLIPGLSTTSIIKKLNNAH
jgi:rfaE bifunctional protein nucleotidyltransferase chain/domain